MVIKSKTTQTITLSDRELQQAIELYLNQVHDTRGEVHTDIRKGTRCSRFGQMESYSDYYYVVSTVKG